LTSEGRKTLESTSDYSFDNAMEKMGSKQSEIDKKYKGKDLGYDFETKEGQNYIKEVSKAWQDLYASELKKQYSTEMTVGDDWVKEAPFMDMYTDFILKE